LVFVRASRAHLLLVEMNTVREHHVLIGDSEPIKISDIAHAGFLLDHFALAFVF
jgi:hypothetical protein